jgi:polyisoprenoid-binding protein YceI
MTYRLTCQLQAAALVVGVLPTMASQAHGESKLIDTAHSTLTVLVYKSGLFSALADNHVISVPISHGSISHDTPLSIEVFVRSADLRVRDPDLAADRQAEVQARMLGPEVLDVATFPEIAFVSTTVEPSSRDRWTVRGRLTIHGHVRSIIFPVARVNGTYRGEVDIKQRDFGIEPIKVAGGVVRVKDELKVQFEIVE